MAEPGEQRRLAAIFAADMVGYSRLMEADERGTISRQKVHRSELIDPKIAEWEAQEILGLEPGFSLSRERRRVIFQKGDDMDRYIAGLRKAGLPE